MSVYTIRVERSEKPWYAATFLPPKGWHGSVADPQGTIHHGYTWTLSGAHRKAKKTARKLDKQFIAKQYLSVYDYDPAKQDDIGWGP